MTLGLREGKNREIKKILEHLGLAVNRLIRVSFGPFELSDLVEGEVTEVRTRVLRDQLGVKLAKEANANFDAPVVDRDEPPRESRQAERPRSERTQRETQRETLGLRRAPQRQSDRGGSGGKGRFERDEAPRRGPLKPSAPERRRKHVSALRTEIAADAADAKAPRKRVERSATHDRKGRSVAVERRSRAHDDAGGRPGREPPERGRRPTSFESKVARDGKGRERIGEGRRSGSALRGALKPDGERDGRPTGRKPGDRKGGRSGSRDSARREGSDAWRSERGPRSNFKPRGPRPQEDDGARPKPSRAGPGRSKGPPHGRGPRRPPRKR
jgi:23S rRNA pseudouridine2605 synthase